MKPPVGGRGKVANNNPINGIRTSVAKSGVFPHTEEAGERSEGETVCAKGIEGVGVDSEDGSHIAASLRGPVLSAMFLHRQ